MPAWQDGGERWRPGIRITSLRRGFRLRSGLRRDTSGFALGYAATRPEGRRDAAWEPSAEGVLLEGRLRGVRGAHGRAAPPRGNRPPGGQPPVRGEAAGPPRPNPPPGKARPETQGQEQKPTQLSMASPESHVDGGASPRRTGPQSTEPRRGERNVRSCARAGMRGFLSPLRGWLAWASGSGGLRPRPNPFGPPGLVGWWPWITQSIAGHPNDGAPEVLPGTQPQLRPSRGRRTPAAATPRPQAPDATHRGVCSGRCRPGRWDAPRCLAT